jgi:hypothetical protein
MDAHEFEQKLRERLASRWKCPNPVGLEPEDLERALSFVEGPIPDLYKCFLKTCGVFAGTLFYEYHWKLGTRETRNRQLRLTSEEVEVRLPPNLYTFLDYIGDFFWCFFLHGDPDPEVLMFDLVELNPVMRFSDFMLKWEQLEEP